MSSCSAAEPWTGPVPAACRSGCSARSLEHDFREATLPGLSSLSPRFRRTPERLIKLVPLVLISSRDDAVGDERIAPVWQIVQNLSSSHMFLNIFTSTWCPEQHCTFQSQARALNGPYHDCLRCILSNVIYN